MLTGNPIQIYYEAMSAFAMLMTLLYFIRWRKHDDVHLTLAFMLIPVVNLAHTLLAHSTNLEEALALNKLIYIGGCFLQLMVMLLVFELCEIRLPRPVKAFFFVFSTVVYIGALTMGTTKDFYTDVRFRIVDGVAVLERTYGWAHSVFYGMVILYLALSLVAIVYAFAKKNQISRKILILLFIPELITVVAYFYGRRVLQTLELTPAAYVLSQVMFLMIASRISLYNVNEAAIDSVAEAGETGFVFFDDRERYLGSNDAAKRVFPGLNKLTVDLSIRRRKDIRALMEPWLRSYAADETQNTRYYDKDGEVYRITISPLIHHRRRKGQQLMVTDDTATQMQLRETENYNRRLEHDVAQATEHLQQMHDRLILGMATMVESRDNSTGGHIRRTSEGVRILLDNMEDEAFDEAFRKRMIKAAPMHDLGKIAVKDSILTKPGRFEPWEYEEMKKHAKEGARIVHEILKDTDDVAFHHIAENMAHYHHERWDGKGYPEGLKGEEIPKEARVMAVADVYDALVSKRVYKEEMPFWKADAIMMEGMGSQFAPEMQKVYEQARPQLEAYYTAVKEEERKREAEENKSAGTQTEAKTDRETEAATDREAGTKKTAGSGTAGQKAGEKQKRAARKA